MNRYYRKRNSIYANYRYNNPNSANFIAPMAHANFFDPSMLVDGALQYGGDAIDWVRDHGGNIINAGRGMLDSAGQAVRPYIDDLGRTIGIGRDFIQAHPGQSAAAGGLAEVGGLGTALLLRRRKQQQASSPGMLERLKNLPANARERWNTLPMGAKAGIGLGAAGVLGGAGYLGYNALNRGQQPEEYSSHLARRAANFRK